ncbi:MAG TPA: phosphoribosyltransferase family protein [Candidatus Saccharimonadales bacterium]|nr:phosphoribosyltransferase family protein [Candidatus Saccharimonadales bacterium]
MKVFADRREAGKLLGERLQRYRGKAVVLALPRGGVETGVEVARALDAPLGLVMARKIGHPMNPEYAVCAVTETGPLVCDEFERADVDPVWLRQAEMAERLEAKRRYTVYLEGREPIDPAGKVAVVVDDGIATGLTMQAALAEVRAWNPERIIVAVPVAPREAANDLLEIADEAVVLESGELFLGAISAYYQSFPQLTDEEVLALLDELEPPG